MFFLNRFFLCIVSIIFFFSCQKSIDTKENDSNKLISLVSSISSSINNSVKSMLIETLNAEEYGLWVIEQKGITYSSVSNNQFSINLIFRPPQLEAYTAAVSNDENPKKSFSKYLEIQSGYYYCTAECTILFESASNPIKKTDLLALMKEQVAVIKNSNDTVTNIITEAFPAHVMNQPNKLLILIPKGDSLSNYKVIIKGSPFNLKDCELNFSSENIKSFPLIKL